MILPADCGKTNIYFGGPWFHRLLIQTVVCFHVWSQKICGLVPGVGLPNLCLLISSLGIFLISPKYPHYQFNRVRIWQLLSQKLNGGCSCVMWILHSIVNLFFMIRIKNGMMSKLVWCYLTEGTKLRILCPTVAFAEVEHMKTTSY